MKLFHNRKVLAFTGSAIGAAGLLSFVGFGGTSALFTSAASTQHNTIAAGTVVLSENGNASHAYNLTGFMPGDGACYSPPVGAKYTCDKPRNEYALTYTGSNPAFVGLNIALSSTAAQPCYNSDGAPALATGGTYTPAQVVAACTGVGQLPLFDGDAAGGDLDLAITPENGDTAHQIVLDSNLVNGAMCSTDGTTDVVTCTSEIDNALLPITYGADTAALQWVTNSTDFVQVDLGLPTTAGNQFQGSGVSIDLTAHAVQWENNNTTEGAVTPSPTCDPGTTFSNGLTAGTVPCPISWS